MWGKKPEKRRTKDINMERLLSNLLLKNVFEKQKESTPRTRSMTQNLKVYIFDCQKKKFTSLFYNALQDHSFSLMTHSTNKIFIDNSIITTFSK